MLILSLIRAGRRRSASLGLSLLALAGASAIAGWPVWVPLIGWLFGSLVLVSVWWLLERPILKLWGYRAPTVEEAARLQPGLDAIQAVLAIPTRPHLVIDECATVAVSAGLRTLIVSRGALEVLEDPQLAGLLAHEFGHLEACEAPADALVWLASTPVVLAWWAAEMLSKAAGVVAFGVAAALVLPLFLWPAWFTRIVRVGLSIVMITIASLLLMATGLETGERGLVAWGLGVMAAPALVPLTKLVLAWEHRSGERRADLRAVEAELGRQLLEALRIVQEVEEQEEMHTGPTTTLQRTHPPTATRIEALQRSLLPPDPV